MNADDSRWVDAEAGPVTDTGLLQKVLDGLHAL